MDKQAGHLKWNQRISYYVIANTELFFYHLGRWIGLKPKTTILMSCLIVILCSIGFCRYHVEKNPLKLWVPQKTSFVEHSEWLMKTFERGIRVEAAILEAPDVLTPEVFRELALIDKEIKGITSSKGDTYENLCLMMPKISPTNEFVTKIKFSCDLLDFVDYTCYENNILDLWDYKQKELESLTKEDILHRINKYKRHPVFTHLKVYENLLGGIVKNKTGHIVSATHLHTMWLLNINFTGINIDETGNNAGTSDFASMEALLWETAFLNRIKELEKEVKNAKMYYSAGRSFGDISNKVMFQDFDLLIAAVFIIVLYVQLVISKFNWIEARMIVTFVGLITILLAFISGSGIAFALGISYSLVHTSLPFLLLGIGLDDIFVIISCWDHLTEEQKKLPVHESIGTMLKHAGVSITITTFTDIVAFLVGSLTIIPSLQSYCLYAAFCLFMAFVLTCTLFVAVFAYDVKRIAANRNCCLIWKVHKNVKKSSHDHQSYSAKAFKLIYPKVILTWPGKMFVMLITIITTGFAIEGVLNLQQKFDPLWFIPTHTYLSKYIAIRKEMYPMLGYEASLFIGAINYTYEFQNIRMLNDKLQNSTDCISYVNSWVPEYQRFVLQNYKIDIYKNILSEDDFHTYLSDFLFRNGSQFQANFQFVEKLKCGQPAPKIEAAGIDFRFREFTGPEEYIPAMRKIIDMTEANNFTTGDKRSFVWSIVFTVWIMDEIIDTELARNIILSLLCVMIATSLLIADFQMCFWIFLCVLLTIVNVAGFMQKWDITINITSCIALQLAIGLCVDYATHIGYTFLTIVDSDRNERVLKTMVNVGSAVMHGGLSTLIAVIMLGFADAYTFTIFFKLFFMETTFGLFNGIVLLPVILSLIGPAPYKSHQPLQQNDIELK